METPLPRDEKLSRTNGPCPRTKGPCTLSPERNRVHGFEGFGAPDPGPKASTVSQVRLESFTMVAT